VFSPYLFILLVGKVFSIKKKKKSRDKPGYRFSGLKIAPFDSSKKKKNKSDQEACSKKLS
jgi:hypothetical protein